MAMSEIELSVIVTEVDADLERVDKLSIFLMRDLLELGVESVKRPSGEELPMGAKGEPLFELGVLALTILPTLVPSLLAFLQTWVSSNTDRTVTVKTPAGFEITFSPETRISEGELLFLVNILTQTSARSVPVFENNPEKQKKLSALRELLTSRFDEGELQTLCFDLGIEYDDLPGSGRANKVRDLIMYLDRHGRIQDLLEIGAQQRPDAAWETITGNAR